MPRERLCPATWKARVPPLACTQPAGHKGSSHYDGDQNHAFGPEDAD
jgi:hypothetical protein